MLCGWRGHRYWDSRTPHEERAATAESRCAVGRKYGTYLAAGVESCYCQHSTEGAFWVDEPPPHGVFCQLFVNNCAEQTLELIYREVHR